MGTTAKIAESEHLVLYDGVCNFCNSSVNFIIKNEQHEELKFAALQSELGQALLIKHGFEYKDFDSIVFVQKGKVFRKGKAAFRIASYLKYPWKLVTIFRVLPAFVTDSFYDLIARNRYKWFGKSDACMLPTPEIRARFLDV